MLKYFRINDPYRLIVLFVLMLAVRLPVMLSGDFLTYPELYNQLVGERMGDGFKLYSEIWTKTGPLSGVIYGVMDLLFGRSQVAWQTISLIVVSIQCFLFNKILLMSKAFNENTYIPGVIYGVLMSWFFDLFTLTPAVLGLTFVLIAIGGVLGHMELKAKRDEQLLYIGLHLGVAVMFYLPYIIVVPLILLCFAFFTGTVPRRYLLFLYGTFLPVVLAIMFYMFTGRLREVFLQFVYTLVDYPVTSYFTWVEFLILFSLPLFFLLAGIFRVIQGARLTVFQSNLSQFMILWLLVGAAYFFINKEMATAYLVIFVPPVSFFISHYFFSIRKKWLAEIAFIIFLTGPVLFNLGTIYSFFFTADFIATDKYIVQANPYEVTTGKSVLVLSTDLSPYQDARSATPFLDYYLSRDLFANPGYYDNLTRISSGFSFDMPDVIIDPEGLMGPVFNKMPTLGKQFEVSTPGVYIRKGN